MSNGGRVLSFLPSDTRIEIPRYVPTSAAVGAPVKAPFDLLKVSHAGREAIENVSWSPSGSLACGVKV
jgi:hypothetical protein